MAPDGGDLAAPADAAAPWQDVALPPLAWLLATSPFPGLEGRPLDWRLPTAVTSACLAELLQSGFAVLDGTSLRLLSTGESRAQPAGREWAERLAASLHSAVGDEAPISAFLRALHDPASQWASQYCLDHGWATVVERGGLRRRGLPSPQRSSRDSLVDACRRRLQDDSSPEDRLGVLVCLVSAVGAADRALSTGAMPDDAMARVAARLAEHSPYPSLLRDAAVALQRPLTGR